MSKQISTVVLEEALKQLPIAQVDKHYVEVEVEDILLRRNPAMKDTEPQPDKLILQFMFDAALKEWVLIL